MRIAPFVLVLILAALSCAEAPSATPIVEAERAFAADGFENGVKASFLRHSAPDAILLAPDPVNAHETLAKRPDADPAAPGPRLIWWPLWAGIAKSGDLGFTTGPFAIGEERVGHYFTVWRKQDDGRWKWVFDAGVGADPSAEDPQGAPVGSLPVSRRGSESPEAAQRDVAALERELAARAANDLWTAYEQFLASDARVHSEGPPPAKSSADHRAALLARASAMTLAALGGGASIAGDMVWTYGDAAWTDASGAAQRGHYARIWQKREEGWRLVFDEVVPRRSGGG